MLVSIFKRYGLILCAALYTAALVLLHLLGRFPAPGPYDVSRLVGSPALTVEGKVLNFPQTRWGQTRFVMEGRALPLEAFRGRLVVDLRFPAEDLAPGEIVKVRGWLSLTRPPTSEKSFDERGYWAGYRAYSVLRVWSPEAFERVHGQEHRAFRQRAWTFHQQFKRFWFEHLPYDEAALLSCITLGSRGVLPSIIKNQCIRAGVYHILVVSGQKMALIIALGVGLLRLVRVPRRRAIWLCGLPIVFYASAVGAEPPVVRAATMAIVALGAMAAGRDAPGYIPFVLAWVCVLICEPEALFGASFQLSFGATAALLALLPWLRNLNKLQPRLLRWIAEAGAVSLAVHAGMWPLLVYYFHQLSLAGVIANWTFFPLSGGVMVLGLLLGTWGVCAPQTVPAVFLNGMHHVLQSALESIHTLSGWSWAAFTLPAPSWRACGFYYALLICILVKVNHD